MTTLNNLHIYLLRVHVVEMIDLLVPLIIRYVLSNSNIILCYLSYVSILRRFKKKYAFLMYCNVFFTN